MKKASYDVLDHVTEDERIVKIRISLKPERMEGETFEEYKIRRKLIKEELKVYKKGKLVHDPFPNGAISRLSDKYPDLAKQIGDRIFKVPGVSYVKMKENGEH